MQFSSALCGRASAHYCMEPKVEPDVRKNLPFQ
jgi:hypothetical protein